MSQASTEKLILHAILINPPLLTTRNKFKPLREKKKKKENSMLTNVTKLPLI